MSNKFFVDSRFAMAPSDLSIRRSRFKKSFESHGTMNAGELIPFYWAEILPGESLQSKTSFYMRMSTPIHPVMDDCFLDCYYFYIPNRLVWTHWNAFISGQDAAQPWGTTPEYTVPQIVAPGVITPGDPGVVPPVEEVAGMDLNSLWDYFALPCYSQNEVSVDALRFRDYVKVWNDWFAPESLTVPAYLYTGDNAVTARRRDNAESVTDSLLDALYGGHPLPVSKYHDVFTSALPAPLRGSPVQVPLVSPLGGLPVGTEYIEDVGYSPLQFSIDYSDEADGYAGFAETTPAGTYNLVGLTSSGGDNAIPLNLSASLADVGVLVSDLRLSFQIQKLLERDARGGGNSERVNETIRGHFGVTVPDLRVQRSEYLGGEHIPVNMSQVVQTSATDDVSPQGNVAGLSVTSSVHRAFSKSFAEHGYVLGVCAIRTKHSYQETVERSWSRKRRFDFYWPEFDSLSEFAILSKEVAVPTLESDDLDEPFGYQEPWYEYRYDRRFVTGHFRSIAASHGGSLDSWIYADVPDMEDTSARVISDEFVYETAANVDRTLAVSSSVHPQFLYNVTVIEDTILPMGLYSIPGLIDHH